MTLKEFGLSSNKTTQPGIFNRTAAWLDNPEKKDGFFKPSFLKAPIRIELMHNGFADRSLTAWAWRHGCYTIAKSDLFV